MADFLTEIPGLVITSDTLPTPDDGRALRHAEGGEIRGRNAYSEPVFKFDVIVKGTLAIKQELKDFYDLYTNDMNTLTIDGTDYSAMFSSPPTVTGKDGDIRWLKFGLLGFEV